MVGASPLGDFDEDTGEGERAVQLAGILCRSSAFWQFISAKSRPAFYVDNEEDATEWLRGKLKIDSRSELKQDEKAREELRVINEKFQEWTDKASL